MYYIYNIKQMKLALKAVPINDTLRCKLRSLSVNKLDYVR